MFFAASRSTLAAHDDAAIAEATAKHPVGRLAQALLDKAYESNDRLWAIRRLEKGAK